jgi:3-methyladenine DNA glycosylase AlkD
MEIESIIEYLKSIASQKYKDNVVKLGIPEENSIGVSTGEIRAYAKKLGKSNDLAMQLWHTGYHEAKLLAVLVFDKKTLELAVIEQLMPEVMSWDLCDHLCKNLIIELPEYKRFITSWCDNEQIYYKRAAFSLIASALIHDKNLPINEIEEFLDMIQQYSSDDRLHVKKAISWALREIGKRDFECLEKAILVAYELKESKDKNRVWIGKDAIKELETLVDVDGRSRLISSKSKMGKEI